MSIKTHDYINCCIILSSISEAAYHTIHTNHAGLYSCLTSSERHSDLCASAESLSSSSVSIDACLGHGPSLLSNCDCILCIANNSEKERKKLTMEDRKMRREDGVESCAYGIAYFVQLIPLVE